MLSTLTRPLRPFHGASRIRSSTASLMATLLILGSLVTPATAAPPREMKIAMEFEEFEKEFDRQLARKFRLIDMSVFKLGSRDLYTGIWEDRADPVWLMRHGMKPDEFEAKIKEFGEMEYVMTHISGKGGGGREKYAAIWERYPGRDMSYWSRLLANDFEKKHNEQTKRGFRLNRMTAFELSGNVVHGGIWEKADPNGRHVRLGQSYTTFQRDLRTNPKKGWRLAQVCTFTLNKQDRYSCLWVEESGPKQEIRVRLTASGVKNNNERFAADGMQPVQICGYAMGTSDRYVVIWEQNTLGE